MSAADSLTGFVRRLRCQAGDGPTDMELLARFADGRDEAAFAELVARHGRLVLGVARRHLPDRQAAEDVVQVTFLALARQARRLGRPVSLVNWLYTVALRQARLVRRRAGRRTAMLNRLPGPVTTTDPLAEVSGRELLTIIDDELARLPATYRLPLLLCALEGLSREEAARRLGWPIGSVKGRLERGRELLRTRLAKRGLTVPAVLAGGLLATPSEALPATLVAAVTRAAVAVPVGGGSAKVALSAVLLLIGMGVGAGDVLIPADQLATPTPSSAIADGRPRIDVLGDPLPNGAIARLGSKLLRPGDRIQALAFSPDGRRFASWSATSQSGTMTIWETATGRELRRVTLVAELKAFRWLADGRGMAVLKVARDEYYIWNFADEANAPPPPKQDPQLRVHGPGELLAIAISPDGRWLATGRRAITTEPRPIEIWELALNQPLSALKFRVVGNQPGHGYKLVFSPDSRTLYALSRTQEPNGQAAPNPGLGPMQSGAVIFGKQADKARVAVYDVVSGQERAAFDVLAPAGESLTGAPAANTVALTSDGKTIVSGHSDSTVRLWDATTGEERRSWKTFEPTDPLKRTTVAVAGLAVVGNQPLITVDSLGGLRRWDLTTGREIGTTMANRTSVQAMALSPDGKSVAAGGSSGSIYLWDVAAGVERTPASGHSKSVDQVFISPDSRTVQTASSDRTIRTWDLASGREMRRLDLDVEGAAWPTAFTLDGRGLVGRNIWGAPGAAPIMALHGGRQKYFWDTETGKQQTLPPVLTDSRPWLLTGPQYGRLLAIDPKDHVVTLRDWPTGRIRQTVPPLVPLPPANAYQTITGAVSADGRLIVVGGEDREGELHRWGRVSLFDGSGATFRWHRSNPAARAEHVAFLPDASAVVVGGTSIPQTTANRNPGQAARPIFIPQQSLIMFAATTGEPVRWFVPKTHDPNGPRYVTALAVSADGRQLAAAERDYSIWVYEVATGEVRRHFDGHVNKVTVLAFTPDGRRLISGGEDLTGVVWDVSLAAGRAGPLPTPADADRLWANMGSSEWEAAGPALATLAVHADAALALLRERMKPATAEDGADPATVTAVIRQLDSEGFAERERAMATLRRHGSDALPAVRERLNQSASAELKQRLTRLVEDIRAFPTPADRLRELRFVELLEQMGTPAAREHLKALAGGTAGATLTRAAAEAFKRLGSVPTGP